MSGFTNPFSGRWVPSKSAKSYTISNYCTNFAMTDTSRIDLRTSKRKRAQVNYFEEPASDDDENDASDAEEQDTKRSQAKKRKTASSKRAPEQKPFPFLELPGELRNKIYMYCLHDPAGIFLNASTKKCRRTVHRETERRFRDLYELPARTNGSEDDDDQDSDGFVADDDDEAGIDQDDADEATSEAPGSKDDEVKEKVEPPCGVKQTLTPALLAVCKQINTEARDILYDHKFHLKNTVALHSFLVDLGPRGAVHLKNIELSEWEWGRGLKSYNHACFTALTYATNLEKFAYRSIRSRNDDPKSAALIFYRDAFPWLEAVGVAKGKADAAVDLVNIFIRDHGSYMSRWDNPNWVPKYDPYKELAQFRTELAKLLNARMDYIRS